ncbi:MAG: HesA/MoeB/ThiF family protein, partial [Planctomycetota bacterium]
MTPDPPPSPDSSSRYHRQTLLDGFGPEVQKRLAQSRVLVVGCGALGTVIVDALARAGVGRLRVVDRDVVEPTNLQRQVLFDEVDAESGAPKAAAAKARLGAINSRVDVEAVVADFNASNAPRLARDVDLLIDGTDNFQTRYLLNDVAVKEGLPYVYGGAVATTGTVYAVLPTPERVTELAASYIAAGAAGPCLRCIEPEPPAAGVGPTCDTVGVLGPVASLVASAQATEALKILTGQWERVNRRLLSIDVYANSYRQIDVSGAYESGACVCCGERRFEFLEGG